MTDDSEFAAETEDDNPESLAGEPVDFDPDEADDTDADPDPDSGSGEQAPPA